MRTNLDVSKGYSNIPRQSLTKTTSLQEDEDDEEVVDLSKSIAYADSHDCCDICHLVFRAPVQLQHCKHVFCMTCIKKWFHMKKTCCRDPSNEKHFVKPVFRNVEPFKL